MSVLVYVNDSAYVVNDGSQVAAEALILDAVQAGAAFIDMHTREGRPVRVLVTPASTIRLENVPPPVEPADEDDVFPDFDFFDTDL